MTTKHKATHKGTCQVCGNLQMLPNGRLSKHGYTVRWGFFEGTCWGAENLPFELSKELIEGAIKRAQDHQASVAAYAKQLRDDKTPATVWVNEYVGASSRAAYLRGDTYRWRELKRADVKKNDYSTLSWEPAKDSQSRDAKRGERQTRDCYLYGDAATLDGCMHYLNGERAKVLDGRVKQLAEYIGWQQARIKGWAPHPEKLVEVAKAS
jgi:hypothetical protein